MSDPDTSGKATTATPESRKTPTSGGAKPLDLTAWKAPPSTTAPEKAPKTRIERPQFPLVKWADLGGVLGLEIVDVWLATSEPKPATATQPAKPSYDYVGANVRLPPAAGHPDGQVVTVLTGQDTVAGQRLVSEFVAGTFDALLNGRATGVAVHALNQSSPDPTRKAKPYTVLTFA